MKLTKDLVNNPLSDSDILKVVQSVKATNATHIAISVPLDFPDYAKKWCNVAHANGLKVIHRGTWSAIEGIYNFTKAVGANRPADTINHWVNITASYIVANPELFADGDLWAVLPERTEGIFQDATAFLPAPLPDNYTAFFNALVDASEAAFAQVGKKVLVGFSANNWTEVNSGWIGQGFFDRARITCVDHYGTDHLPASMYTELKAVYDKHLYPVFLQEWGNYWNNGSLSDAVSMFDTFDKLAADKILVGFNYWGGWSGNPESIFNADYSLNDKGKELAKRFANAVPTPVIQTIEVGEEQKVTSGYHVFFRPLKINGKEIGKLKVYRK